VIVPTNLTRRDFIKLIGTLPLVMVNWPERRQRSIYQPGVDRLPNILVLVFDAFSAYHIPFYGYRRQTTPNLSRFANRATVFHSHYAGGNFTTPGTASLLTGTYPWSHHALQIQGTVLDEFRNKNIFSLLGEKGYTRIGFSHNIVVDSLLDQFRSNIDNHTNTRELFLVDDNLADRLFAKDFTPATHAEGLITRRGETYSSSLFLYQLYRFWISVQQKYLLRRYGELFPRGLPRSHNTFFLLEDAIDWTMHQLEILPQPFLAYIHLLPPHDPYATRREFIDRFDDGWDPPPRPPHPLSDRQPDQILNKYRREYDEYIAYADAEFGRLYDFMDRNGILNNTYVIFTSDHGELFERGVWGHITPVLFEPVIRVPLLISKPGQPKKQDVYTNTSCVDILPTLLYLAEIEKPDWCEGEVLPTIGEEEPASDRSVFSVEAKSNPKFAPLRHLTVSMIRDRYKLVHYLGYQEYDDIYEMYDLNDDPGEMNNIYSSRKSVASDLQGLLNEQLMKANQRFINLTTLE
jgi:arylsulfatase A-like enzyme